MTTLAAKSSCSAAATALLLLAPGPAAPKRAEPFPYSAAAVFTTVGVRGPILAHRRRAGDRREHQRVRIVGGRQLIRRTLGDNCGGCRCNALAVFSHRCRRGHRGSVTLDHVPGGPR